MLDAQAPQGADGRCDRCGVRIHQVEASDRPIDLNEVRQVWIEVVVTDEEGHELLRSGTLDGIELSGHEPKPANNKVVDA